MVTAFYASLSGLWVLWLSINVIKSRRKHQVRYGDGDVLELQIARSAHSNALEYIPITLILMFFLESTGVSVWFIHITGIALLVSRYLHGMSMLRDKLKGRVRGMQITFANLLALSVLNLINVIWRWVV